jgi:hypothetical protein
MERLLVLAGCERVGREETGTQIDTALAADVHVKINGAFGSD